MEIRIVYATQTGTAASISEELKTELEACGVLVDLLSVEKYSFSYLSKEKIVLFVCSTTGDGDVPKAMAGLWQQLLSARLPPHFLAGIRFGVFGLGDRAYSKFNYAARKLDARLKQLGATALLPCGLGDVQALEGCHTEFCVWREKLFHAFGLEKKKEQTIIRRSELPLLKQAASHYTPFFLKSNARITDKSHFQDVRHVVFRCKQSHRPGDLLFLYPVNPLVEAEKAASLLGLSPVKSSFVFVKTSRRDILDLIEDGCNVLFLFRNVLDIGRVPPQAFFSTLGLLSRPGIKKDMLIELGAVYEKYFTYCLEPRRTALEVLEDFHEVLSVQAEHLLALFPVLRPRVFSISSFKAGEISITVAGIREKTSMATDRLGLTYKTLLENKVRFYKGRILSGDLSIEENVSSALVLVCTGVGIGPMRGIIQWAVQRKTKAAVHLFFGFRARKMDLHYMDEWKALGDAHENFFFHGAASRDDGVYVQTLLRQSEDLIKDLLNAEKGMCFVCGSKAMEQAVEGVLEAILSCEEMEQMRKERRYRKEAWSRK
eukprot:GHVN01033653.1.p1 GENE.GHVN01033653.1~~GHVN01033653.1.p1  ORF type:complete len:544 (+),score=55.95 GHVN01033653.1:3113-4744(+)